MKYPVGTKVLFTNGDTYARHFLTETYGIPRNMIKHGSRNIGSKIQKIVGHCMVDNQLVYIVEYLGVNGNTVRLGWKPEYIKLYNHALVREF